MVLCCTIRGDGVISARVVQPVLEKGLHTRNMEVGRNQREIAVPRLIITVTSDLERNLISKHYVNDGKIYELCFIDRKIEAQSSLQVGGSHCSRALILLVPESCWDLNSSFGISPYIYCYLLSQMCFHVSKIITQTASTILHKTNFHLLLHTNPRILKLRLNEYFLFEKSNTNEHQPPPAPQSEL